MKDPGLEHRSPRKVRILDPSGSEIWDIRRVRRLDPTGGDVAVIHWRDVDRGTPIHITGKSFSFERLQIDGTPLRGRSWSYTAGADSGQLCAKRIWPQIDDGEHETVVRWLPVTGGTPQVWHTGSDTWMADVARSSGLIALVTGEQTSPAVCTYSSTGEKLHHYDLSPTASHHYHVRCISLSPEGFRLLVTAVDHAMVMDGELRMLEEWRVPINDGWIRDDAATTNRTTTQALKVFGLDAPVSRENLRRHFRERLFRNHPDLNPSDPEATQRTKDVIWAYELLSKELATNAFREGEEAERYYKLLKVSSVGASRVEIHIVGHEKDWIYASHVTPEGSNIYLGTYAGKVYRVHPGGTVSRTINLGDTIREIREWDENLLLRTHQGAHLIRNKESLVFVPIAPGSQIACGPKGMAVAKSKEVRIYDTALALVAVFQLRTAAVSIAWTGVGVLIETAHDLLLVSIREGDRMRQSRAESAA